AHPRLPAGRRLLRPAEGSDGRPLPFDLRRSGQAAGRVRGDGGKRGRHHHGLRAPQGAGRRRPVPSRIDHVAGRRRRHAHDRERRRAPAAQGEGKGGLVTGMAAAITPAGSAAKRRIAALAFWSIVVALIVLGLKAVAWWMTGSVALYSDALESTVNVIAAAAAFWAIRVSHKPADEDHPFGHHKAEYFSAVLEGVLIVVAALLILSEVWRSWRNTAPLEQPWEGLAVNGVATVINAAWAWALIRAGRNARSPA